MKPNWFAFQVLASSLHRQGKGGCEGISRREFLSVSAAAAAQLLVAPCLEQGSGGLDDTIEVRFPMPASRIIRPEDFLILDFQFKNLSLERRYREPFRLVRTGSGPCLIFVILPPQHIQEEVFDSAHPFTGTRPRSWIAGKSQLVFRISEADAATGFGYSLSELLRVCRDADVVVSPNAPPRNLADPSVPFQRVPASYEALFSSGVTAIEAPYRLFLSPNRYAAWSHSLLPRIQHPDVPAGAQSSGTPGIVWTEIWHTLLTVRPPNGQSENDLRTLRAIWSPDYASPLPQDFVSLQGDDRKQLVQLTAEFDDLDTSGNHTQTGKIQDRLGRVIQVEQLALSSLGATMKLLYDQAPPTAAALAGPGPDLSTWRHETIIARDQYVKVVHEGYLYPWGHRAAFIQISQRKFAPDPAGSGNVSYLEKTFFILVKQRSNSYRLTNPLAMFPEVAIAEGQIQIDPPCSLNSPPTTCQRAGNEPFWILVDGKPFLFDATLTDHNGNRSHFHPGAFFVPFGPLESGTGAQIDQFLKPVQAAYRSVSGQPARYVNFQGQPLAFAPWTANQNTTLLAFHITFDAQHIIQTTDRAHLFCPTVQSAEAQIPPLNHLRGTEMLCTMQYASPYLRNGQGFSGANAGKVFAELTTPVPLDFTGDLSHGKPVFITRISVIALSANTVIVGGLASGSDEDRQTSLEAFAAGTFDPQLYFEELRLLHTADLRKMLDKATSQAPVLTYTNSGHLANAVLDWHGKFQVRSRLGDDLKVAGAIHFNSSRQTGQGTADALTFTDVNNLLDPTRDFDFTYDHLRYASGSSQSDSIGVGLINPRIRSDSQLQFTGNFFSLLRDHAFQGGATYENGYLVLRLGFRVPDFDLGLFALHGLAISLLLRLGTLVANSGFEFKIADPNSPCALSVAMFYGKGYFVLRCSLLAAAAAELNPALAVTTAGCSFSLDMSFEFGAGVDLHLWKIASLSASISAGIHFELLTDNLVRLVGYFSCHGSLHVLGIGFNVGFDAAFDVQNGYILHVFVNLHVEIDMFFFSIGVDVPVEFSFGGQPLPQNQNFNLMTEALVAPAPQGAPAKAALTFKDQMTRKDWQAYCNAFA
jgi:hypothetical protein